MFELIDAETGLVVVPQVDVAPCFSARGARGLLGRAGIDEHAGLLLSDPLRCIHTIGMRFVIDIVFLDRELRVVRVAERVRPWRLRWCRAGRHQLELASGTASDRRLVPGRRVALKARSDDYRGHAVPESPLAISDAGDADHSRAHSRCVGSAVLPSVLPLTRRRGESTNHSGRRAPCVRIC